MGRMVLHTMEEALAAVARDVGKIGPDDKWMAAVWSIRGDKVSLDRVTYKFPVAELLRAVSMLADGCVREEVDYRDAPARLEPLPKAPWVPKVHAGVEKPQIGTVSVEDALASMSGAGMAGKDQEKPIVQEPLPETPAVVGVARKLCATCGPVSDAGKPELRRDPDNEEDPGQ